jgi:hypothetical protein
MKRELIIKKVDLPNKKGYALIQNHNGKEFAFCEAWEMRNGLREWDTAEYRAELIKDGVATELKLREVTV